MKKIKIYAVLLCAAVVFPQTAGCDSKDISSSSAVISETAENAITSIAENSESDIETSESNINRIDFTFNGNQISIPHLCKEYDFFEVKTLFAADDAVPVRPDKCVEGHLQRACVKNIFTAHDHVDERQGKVADIAVNHAALVNCVQLQRFFQDFQRQDPNRVCTEAQCERTKKTV